LGEKPSKKGMEVINAEKVFFYLNNDSILKVTCSEPLEIVNHHTGYHIQYVLDHFIHDYKRGETTLYGMPHYKETSTFDNRQAKRWKKKRKEMYDVSITRFIRSLYQNQVHKEGFLLVKKDSLKNGQITPVKTEELLQVDQNQFLLNISEPLYLACFSTPVTSRMLQNIDGTLYRGLGYTHGSFPVMQLLPQQITIFSDGTYSGLLKINPSIGLSSMLPVEYGSAFTDIHPDSEPLEHFDTDNFSVINHEVENEITKFIPYLRSLRYFSENIPREKVYLHFDNTSYYQGDNIWFKCYVVSGRHQLSQLSKTLYVELLNPGGEIIDKRILRIENGQCHGEFMLNRLPFYSGFYEVRAYTKYMLNFGDDVIFSRLLPIFDKPKVEGNFEEKKMLKYGRWGIGNYQVKREYPIKEKKVNLRFFPEGGHLIQGVTSRIAFEATDEIGNPIDITGVVMNAAKQEICSIATQHEGRGVFNFNVCHGGLAPPSHDSLCHGGLAPPSRDNLLSQPPQKYIAEVEYSGKKYRFDLPAPLSQGIIMEVDNLSNPESIGITLRKNSATNSQLFGVAVLHGGLLQHYLFAYTADNETQFHIDKTQFPVGVTQIVLFNSNGNILCDRLVFVDNNTNYARLQIQTKTDKSVYKPHELVEMGFAVSDSEDNPVQTTFSLSVRDGDNEVDYKRNILIDLLLMSEIKGYVRNPSFYFDFNCNPVCHGGLAPPSHDTPCHGGFDPPSLDKETKRLLLDQLLMVQGWRRYPWEQMTGIKPFEIKYSAEQGLEINGQIISFGIRQVPKSNVDVGLLLQKREENGEVGGSFIDSFVTDSLGRFSFVSNVEGRWNMILNVTEKGKKKHYQILLDRVFSPAPKRYRYADMQVSLTEKNDEKDGMNNEKVTAEDVKNDLDSLFFDLQESLAQSKIDKKVHQLPEVTVRGKRNKQDKDVVRNRSNSIAYYDVPSATDELYDKGQYVGNDIHELLLNINKNFFTKYYKWDDLLIDKTKEREIIENLLKNNPSQNYCEFLSYKNKMPLFVINYRVGDKFNEIDYFKYKRIKLNAIKSIYINESISAKCQYAFEEIQQELSCNEIDRLFSCIVFIETYPDNEIPVEGAKGVRKTWLEGYTTSKEFYCPDYSVLPPEQDYRRTLYWNPEVTTNEDGTVKIHFYNNSSCKTFSISAETVTEEGRIGTINN